MILEEAKKIGARIKLIRHAKNWQQSNLAAAIGVSQSLLSNMEAGRCSVTLENLIKLHEVLDCPMRDFFVDLDGEYDRKLPENYFSLDELAGALVSLRHKEKAIEA